MVITKTLILSRRNRGDRRALKNKTPACRDGVISDHIHSPKSENRVSPRRILPSCVDSVGHDSTEERKGEEEEGVATVAKIRNDSSRL
jgi:hypothetical protein